MWFSFLYYALYIIAKTKCPKKREATKLIESLFLMGF